LWENEGYYVHSIVESAKPLKPIAFCGCVSIEVGKLATFLVFDRKNFNNWFS